MITSSKTYGFNYEHRGKTYAFDVLADSEESAKQRVAAMAEAVFVGELREASSEPQPASLTISSSEPDGIRAA